MDLKKAPINSTESNLTQPRSQFPTPARSRPTESPPKLQSKGVLGPNKKTQTKTTSTKVGLVVSTDSGIKKNPAMNQTSKTADTRSNKTSDAPNIRSNKTSGSPDTRSNKTSDALNIRSNKTSDAPNIRSNKTSDALNIRSNKTSDSPDTRPNKTSDALNIRSNKTSDAPDTRPNKTSPALNIRSNKPSDAPDIRSNRPFDAPTALVFLKKQKTENPTEKTENLTEKTENLTEKTENLTEKTFNVKQLEAVKLALEESKSIRNEFKEMPSDFKQDKELRRIWEENERTYTRLQKDMESLNLFQQGQSASLVLGRRESKKNSAVSNKSPSQTAHFNRSSRVPSRKKRKTTKERGDGKMTEGKSSQDGSSGEDSSEDPSFTVTDQETEKKREIEKEKIITIWEGKTPANVQLSNLVWYSWKDIPDFDKKLQEYLFPQKERQAKTTLRHLNKNGYEYKPPDKQ